MPRFVYQNFGTFDYLLNMHFPQPTLDKFLEKSDVFCGRARALLWRIRGAAIGQKSHIGSRSIITKPWCLRTGMRCRFESDITLKLVGESSFLSIGDDSYIARFSQFDILGKCEIGNNVLIATGCTIIDHNHGVDRSKRIYAQPCILKPVVVEDDVWLGSNSVVLPGVRVGTGAVIGACACVTKDIPSYAIVARVPARVIGFRRDISESVVDDSISEIRSEQHCKAHDFQRFFGKLS